MRGNSDGNGIINYIVSNIHKGRPPTPICNPGLAAIDAVIDSQDSEYLYYLHDSQGQIHLAKTYEEHLANIEQYLK